MELILLTGMSGAGKSLAASYLEDMGYFCVENLPPEMLVPLVQSFLQKKAQGIYPLEKLALTVDVRSKIYFSDFQKALLQLEELKEQYDLKTFLLFLDASEEVLISRYKQSRRMHPLCENCTLDEALKKERKALLFAFEKADLVLDTSNMSNTDLREYFYRLLKGNEKRLQIYCVSFGFKYGLPVDCDLVQDVRFLPNPYYDKHLRSLTGQDEEVSSFVLQTELAQSYAKKYLDLLEFSLPYYVQEGKVRLVLGIGCTGGRHRSVALCEWFAKKLEEKGYLVKVFHRDLQKDPANVTKQSDYQKIEEKK